MSSIARVLFSPWIRGIDADNIDAYNQQALKIVSCESLPRGAWEESGWIPYRVEGALVDYKDPETGVQTQWIVRNESPQIIGGKLFELAVAGIPAHIALRTAYYVAKTAILLLWTFVGFFVFLGMLTCGLTGYYDIKRYKEKCLTPLKESSISIARTIFYGIGMEFAAIVGILFDPIKGRARYGLLERKLNNGVTFREVIDVFREWHRDGGEKKLPNGFYLAACMQPLVEDLNRKGMVPDVCYREVDWPKRGWKVSPTDLPATEEETKLWCRLSLYENGLKQFLPEGMTKEEVPGLLRAGDQFLMPIRKTDIEPLRTRSHPLNSELHEGNYYKIEESSDRTLKAKIGFLPPCIPLTACGVRC